MDFIKKHFLETPVTWFLFGFLTLVSFWGNTASFIDCSDTQSLSQQFIHSFIHVQPTHLLANLYSLYSLRYIEKTYGSFKYALLILLLAFLTSLMQSWFAKLPVWPFPTCSVGFSAVLLGLIIFDRLNINNWTVDGNQLIYMFLILILPVIKNPRTSLTGHLAGILAGLLLGVLAGFFRLDF